MEKRIQKLVFLGLFIALSIVLQRISFPIIPIAPYLKLEFSSIPIITLAILYSYNSATIAAFVVNLIDYMFNPSLTGFPLDQFINFIAILVFVFTIQYFIRKKQYLLAFIVPVCVNVITLTLLNYYFLTPLYFGILKLPLPDNFFVWSLRVYGVFNLVKWGLVGSLYLLIYKQYFKHLKNI